MNVVPATLSVEGIVKSTLLKLLSDYSETAESFSFDYYEKNS